MTIMGGIAEFERNLIRKRCEEGIQRAKRKGTKFGRPTALDPSQRRRIAERYTAGETMVGTGARVRMRGSDDLAGSAIAVKWLAGGPTSSSVAAIDDLPDGDADVFVVFARDLRRHHLAQQAQNCAGFRWACSTR